MTYTAGQSISYRARLSLRIMLGLWLLMMIVLVNSYTGVLTSYMAIPKLNPIPQSLEEFAASKEYKVSMQKNQLLADAFLVFMQYSLLCIIFRLISTFSLAFELIYHH